MEPVRHLTLILLDLKVRKVDGLSALRAVCPLSLCWLLVRQAPRQLLDSFSEESE
jgi:hypothetical protein